MFLQKKRFKEPRRLIFSAAASGFFLIRVISFSSSVVKAKLDICESCGHFFCYAAAPSARQQEAT